MVVTGDLGLGQIAIAIMDSSKVSSGIGMLFPAVCQRSFVRAGVGGWLGRGMVSGKPWRRKTSRGEKNLWR